MHLVFPDDGWDEPSLRIAHYLATERDDAEDRFPDIADHWASYGFAEMTRWPGLEGGAALDDEMRAYTRHIAELESMQARWDSTRTNSGWSRLTRGAQALGAGVGTIGEALTMLWRTPGLSAPACWRAAARSADRARQIDMTGGPLPTPTRCGTAHGHRHADRRPAALAVSHLNLLHNIESGHLMNALGLSANW
jgi:hypothetical protein